MATLAEQYKAQAIQWKITNAQAEKTAAEQRINTLATRVQALITSEGALYIQILNSGTDIPTYKAIITKWGRLYLESLGFRVEQLTTHANIWWGDPTQVEKEVDDIINPPIKPSLTSDTGSDEKK